MTTSTRRPPVTAAAPPSVPRLLLQPTASWNPLLDGGWWPRSNDPVAELPGLILALDAYRGPIHRILLGSTGWATRPELLGVVGRVVRLSWLTTMPSDLLTAISANGARVELLVVPPGIRMPTAWAAIGLAAQSDNATAAAELITVADRLVLTAETTTENNWESEGGRPRVGDDEPIPMGPPAAGSGAVPRQSS